ncbi:MAG: hypothetical protein ABSG15_13495 [FCB group bacterium]|jgi:hypothetical protein
MKRICITSLISVLILFAIQSCGEMSKPEMTPVQYNDFIIVNQTKVIQKFIDLSKTFDKHIPKEIDEQFNLLQIQVDSAVASTSTLSNFKGNSEFKDAALKLFQFYQDGLKNDYKQMIEILKKGPEGMNAETMKKMTDLSQSFDTKEKVLNDAFIKAQNNFATQFKIEIKPNQLQKELDKMGN